MFIIWLTVRTGGIEWNARFDASQIWAVFVFKWIKIDNIFVCKDIAKHP